MREDQRTQEKPPEPKKDPIIVAVADCPCGASLSGPFPRVDGWATIHLALHRYWRRRELHP